MDPMDLIRDKFSQGVSLHNYELVILQHSREPLPAEPWGHIAYGITFG